MLGAPLRTVAVLGPLVIFGGVTMVGCVRPQPSTIVRHLDGQRREGAFISPYSYEWFVRGELAMSRGRYADAARAYLEARAGSGDDPLLLARLAEAYEASGKREQADRALEDGLDAAPHAETLHLARGRILEGRNRPDAAVAAYARAIDAAPQSDRGPLALAALLAHGGEVERAAAVLSDFISRAGTWSTGALRADLELALLRGDADRALAAAERLLRRMPASADEVQRLSRALIEQGHAEPAVRLLGAIPPAHRDPNLWLDALVRARRFDEVEATLKTSSPDALGGPVALAARYLEIGKPAIALELVGAIPKGTPPSPAQLLVTARAHLLEGHVDEAVRLLMAIPSGTSVSERAHDVLIEAVARGGMPALARELATINPNAQKRSAMPSEIGGM